MRGAVAMSSVLLEPGGIQTGLLLGLATFGTYIVLILLSRPIALRLDRAIQWQRVGDSDTRAALRLALHCALLFIPSGVGALLTATALVCWCGPGGG